MRFAILMVTRANPRRAGAVIEVLETLKSEQHEIVYVVGCDDDDQETVEYFRDYRSVRLSVAKRAIGLGAIANRCAASVEADFYLPYADDVFPAIANWDWFISSFMKRYGRPELGVIAWNDMTNPGQCSMPIITREWFELNGLYPEYFPYWFYDTWVNEVYSFTTGNFVQIPVPLILAGKKGLTRSMRDLKFWIEFYSFTRAERLDKASQLRERLGLSVPDNLDLIVSIWRERDQKMLDEWHKTETTLSLKGDPSIQYIEAKRQAEQLLAA